MRNLLLLVTATIPLCFLLGMIAVYGVDMPFMDEWELVPLIEKSFLGQATFHDFWAQQNEHRIVFPKLLLVSLARWTSWNIQAELYLNVILAVGILFFVCKIMLRAQKAFMDYGFVWLLPALSGAAFSLRQWENWLMGVNVVIYLSVFCAVAGIFILSSGVFRWWRFCAGAILGIVSTYSFSTGFAYWPVGFFLLGLTSFPSRQTRKIALLSWMMILLATVGAYLIGYQQPSHLPAPWHVLRYPFDLLFYAILYLGSLMRFSPPLSLLAGLVGVACFVRLTYKCFTMPCANRACFTGVIALGIFAMLNALITGLGRAELLIFQAMTSRYVAISWLFWASLLVLGAMVGKQLESDRKTSAKAARSVRQIKVVLCTTITVAIFASSVHSLGRLRERSALLSKGQAELFVLKNDVLLQQIYFPNVNILKDRVKILKDRKWSAFR